MILPITTEHDQTRWPVANVAIVVLTCLATAALNGEMAQVRLAALAYVAGDPHLLDGVAGQVVLQRGDPRLTQLLGHAFMHSGFWHLLGNMLLLLPLGNAVNARIGHGRYLILYALSAILGASGWLLFGDARFAVGASGAVSGVAAAFLVLFPITRVRVLFWALGLVLAGVALLHERIDPLVLVAIAATCVVAWVAHSLMSLAEESPPEGALLRVLGFRTFPLAGVWVVLWYLGGDIVALASGALDGVAHEAHLAGSAGGVLMAAVLLATRTVRGSTLAPTLFDLLGWTRPSTSTVDPEARPTRRLRPALTFSDYARLRRV